MARPPKRQRRVRRKHLATRCPPEPHLQEQGKNEVVSTASEVNIGDLVPTMSELTTATKVNHTTEASAVSEATVNEQKDSLFFTLLNKDCRFKVYEAMLSFNEEYKSEVQVLATCKRLNKEATKFLYGPNNSYDIKLLAQGASINGSLLDLRQVGEIEWPGYLLKCKRLRIGLGPYDEHGRAFAAAFSGAHPDSLPHNLHIGASTAETVFWFLCEYLGQKHSLISLTVDLRVPPLDQDNHKDSDTWTATIADLYSFRLIQKPGLRFITQGVVDPYQWRSSPTVLPQMVALTPELAVTRVYRGMAAIITEIYFTSGLDMEDRPTWDLIMKLVLGFLQAWKRSGDACVSGAHVFELMHQIFRCASATNGTKGPVACADDPRYQIYAIKHAVVELKFSCNMFGVDADALLEARFNQIQPGESWCFSTVSV